jgi:hypothetical protein
MKAFATFAFIEYIRPPGPNDSLLFKRRHNGPILFSGIPEAEFSAPLHDQNLSFS